MFNLKIDKEATIDEQKVFYCNKYFLYFFYNTIIFIDIKNDIFEVILHY